VTAAGAASVEIGIGVGAARGLAVEEAVGVRVARARATCVLTGVAVVVDAPDPQRTMSTAARINRATRIRSLCRLAI
jgi:hypothetical protein